ncbi:MAG: hypothetical protein KF802_02860 [Bdellovibrionaceae bacterium]|nr:hypothetical protein [Pseudobdellovibrionaceae bacterium]
MSSNLDKNIILLKGTLEEYAIFDSDLISLARKKQEILGYVTSLGKDLARVLTPDELVTVLKIKPTQVPVKEPLIIPSNEEEKIQLFVQLKARVEAYQEFSDDLAELSVISKIHTKLKQVCIAN